MGHAELNMRIHPDVPCWFGSMCHADLTSHAKLIGWMALDIALLDHADLIKWKKARDACMISYGSIGKTSPVHGESYTFRWPWRMITLAIPCPRDDLAWPSSSDWPPLLRWASPVLCGLITHCGALDMDGCVWEEMTSTKTHFLWTKTKVSGKY